MNNKLKPCPFCGRKAKAYAFYRDDEKVWYIACSSKTCDVKPHTITVFEKRKSAVAAWNKRAE